MSETYASARVRLHRELGTKGWKTSKLTLKVLWAELDGARLEFRPQAVYLNGHSLFIDMRGCSVEVLIEFVRRAAFYAQYEANR